MANPQVENGYTKIVNEIMDALMYTRIPGEARQILDVILRKTYGWNKKEDQISLSQFVEFTGLSKTHVCRGINKLLSMNIITKKGNALSLFTQKGNDIAVTYGLQKDFEKWVALPKKVTLPKKVKHVTQKGNLTLPKKGTTKDTITKDTITKDIYSIFDFWNNQEMFVHRKIDKLKPAIKSALGTYKLEEITEAISNYKIVLESDEYYWTHRWTLKEFLQRGLEKFITANNPFSNYRAKGAPDGRQNFGKGTKQPTTKTEAVDPAKSDGRPYPIDLEISE